MNDLLGGCDPKNYEACVQSTTMVMEEIELIHSRFPKPFNSYWELYGVLCEEIEEFWDSVKANSPDMQELKQVAAVAITGFMQSTAGSLAKSEPAGEADVPLSWQELKGFYTQLMNSALESLVENRRSSPSHSSHEIYGMLSGCLFSYLQSMQRGVPNSKNLVQIASAAMNGMTYLRLSRRDEVSNPGNSSCDIQVDIQNLSEEDLEAIKSVFSRERTNPSYLRLHTGRWP